MDFINWLRGKPSSKDVAKSRLKFVLVQDRINCSPDMLDDMRDDILEVISKYMDIDEEKLDIEISNVPDEDGNDDANTMLYVNIPVTGSGEKRGS